MLSKPEKAYCQALLALKNKEYRVAADCFDKAAPFFGQNEEFNLLRETNHLLVSVKNRLAAQETQEQIAIEELNSHGQETELR